MLCVWTPCNTKYQHPHDWVRVRVLISQRRNLRTREENGHKQSHTKGLGPKIPVSGHSPGLQLGQLLVDLVLRVLQPRGSGDLEDYAKKKRN